MILLMKLMIFYKKEELIDFIFKHSMIKHSAHLAIMVSKFL